jgi:hypothetical protein
MAVAALECRIDHELDDKLDMNVARSACLIEPLEFKLAYSASDQVGSTDVVANLDVAMSTSEVEMHLSPTDVAMLLQIVSGLTAIGPAWSTAATTDKSRNLALWCPCAASSERDEGHRAAFATNPQPGTRWVADFAQVKQRNDAKWEQWIYVDLLEVCSVESVRITFDGSAFAADFDVQLSRHSPTLHRWRSTESRRSHKGSFAEVRIIRFYAVWVLENHQIAVAGIRTRFGHKPVESCPDSVTVLKFNIGSSVQMPSPIAKMTDDITLNRRKKTCKYGIDLD